MSRVQKPKPSTNVLEYERKKKMEKDMIWEVLQRLKELKL